MDTGIPSLYTVIPNYCSNNPAESSSGLDNPSGFFAASLGTSLNLSCPNAGVLVSGSLLVTCQYSTATQGSWSIATATCYSTYFLL